MRDRSTIGSTETRPHDPWGSRREWRPSALRAVTFLAVLAAVLLAAPALAADALLGTALDSITTDELQQHVDVLADDVYEGRAFGSRGGRAASQYLVQRLREYPLEPAGTEGDFAQPFDDEPRGKSGRNLLALLPGSDPRLAEEVILIGAHYDHVGTGRKGTSYGPLGQIHNGADDNASGVSALLELIEAFAESGLSPRRSILFAFWDGEEDNLLGSRYWIGSSTLPLEQVKLAFNVDMIGRLRDGRLQVLGTRSGYGLRRFLSGPVAEPLWLDFSWALSANSDHWPFLEQQIPIVVLHTGLHDDYHRPTDNADRINREGLREVSHYLLAMLFKASNADVLPPFREGAKTDTVTAQRRLEEPLRAAWPAYLPPPRVGISWREDAAEPGTVFLTRVVEGTPGAAAGLAVGDRVYELAQQPFAGAAEFRTRIGQWLDSGRPELEMLVESRGRLRTIVVRLASEGESGTAESGAENEAAGE